MNECVPVSASVVWLDAVRLDSDPIPHPADSKIPRNHREGFHEKEAPFIQAREAGAWRHTWDEDGRWKRAAAGEEGTEEKEVSGGRGRGRRRGGFLERARFFSWKGEVGRLG